MWQTKAIVPFTLLSIIFIQGSSGVYWPCETQSDCTAVGSECSSTTNLCECNGFDTVFSEDFTKCLKTSLFGDTCEATVQCNLMPSGANCKSGVCDCADGHQYVRGRCRAANGLDQQCETDLDCYFGYDRQSVTCQNNVCACANGYYRRHSNICRRKAMKIGDACVVDTDCDAIASNVQCKSLKCQYVDELHQLNSLINQSNVPKTNTHTRTRTRTHSQPQSQAQSQSQAPTQFNVEAEIALSPATDTAAETPKTETESSSLDFNSSDNTAKASQRSGSTPILVNGNGTDNDEAADDTTTDIDEHDDDNNKSQESQAKANIEHKPLELKRSREIAVQTSIEGFELKDLSNRQFRDVGTGTTSTSTSSRITSHSNNHQQQRRRPATGYRFNDLDDDIKTFSTLSNTDEEVPEKYGSACAENGKPCDGLPHSVCSNNICFCKQGYYPKNSKCFAELGEIAESSDECEYDFEETTKKCVCQPNFFYERNLRGCRKPITYNLSCTSNSQCSPFGAAFCKPEIPRRCNCAEFAEYDAFLQMCVFKQGLGAECDRNEGCPVEHSICQNRYCVCKETFFEKDGACVRGLGAECAQNDECKAENSVCEPKTASSDDEPKDRTCQCRKGFVHFKDQCLQEAEDIDDECIETEQCKPLLGTCVDKKCKCTETQQFKNGRCENKKEIGEPCSRAGECFVEKDPENVECRNSVCQCKFGYQPSTEQKTCIRVTPNKKNSSGRPSALKIVTFVLIGSAFLITSAAIKQAYYV